MNKMKENLAPNPTTFPPIASWEWYVDQDEISWSQNIAQILTGFSADLVDTWPAFKELIQTEDRPTLDHALQEAQSSGEPFEVDIRCLTGEPEPMRLSLSGVPFLAEDGSVVRLIGMIRHKDRPLVTPAKIAGQPIPALLELLKTYEDRTRYRVRRELRERDTAEVMAALDTWIAGLDQADENYQHNLLEALWVHQHHDVVDEDFLKQLLRSPD